MAQRIDKIEMELAKLEGAIASMGQHLLTTYPPYLKLLSKTVQRQIVVAVYHACTDIYAETFLQLSLKQRLDLQAKVRQIAQGIMGQLLNPLGDLEKIIYRGEEVQQAKEVEQVEQVEEVKQVKKVKGVSGGNRVRRLVHWQRHTESEIGQVLQQGSKEVNNLLHQVGLFPQLLPIALLETAAKMESRNATAVIARPNTINLVVERENKTLENNVPEEEDTTPRELLPLTAIYLRLGDLEFSDPELGKLSNDVRALVTKLYALDREYHKQLKIHQVAQAQSAWRSTWVDD